MEEWRDIPGYEGRYQASDAGRVRSLDHYVRLVTRKGEETKRLSPGKMLRPGPSRSGHLSVALGKGNSVSVHRLVLLAFVGPCPEGCEALHGPDPNPANNRLANLRYGTRGENVIDDYRNGTRSRSVTDDQVREIRRRAARGLVYGEKYGMALEFDCNSGTVHKIISGEYCKDVR